MNERDSVMVHDTVVEVTTVTIRENERGDTVRVSTVTDRARVRDRSAIRDVRERVRVEHDTVFVQKTNSVVASDRTSPWGITLKWIFWIIIGLMGAGLVLIIIF